MKRFSTILRYLKDQKRGVLLYFIFNVLSILFSLVSLAMLGPFLQLLFGKDKLVTTKVNFVFSAGGIFDYLKYLVSTLIIQHDKVYALAAICLVIIVSI